MDQHTVWVAAERYLLPGPCVRFLCRLIHAGKELLIRSRAFTSHFVTLSRCLSATLHAGAHFRWAASGPTHTALARSTLYGRIKEAGVRREGCETVVTMRCCPPIHPKAYLWSINRVMWSNTNTKQRHTMLPCSRFQPHILHMYAMRTQRAVDFSA